MLGNVSCHILRESSDKKGKSHYKEGLIRQPENTHSIYSKSSGATCAMLSKKPKGSHRWNNVTLGRNLRIRTLDSKPTFRFDIRKEMLPYRLYVRRYGSRLHWPRVWVQKHCEKAEWTCLRSDSTVGKCDSGGERRKKGIYAGVVNVS